MNTFKRLCYMTDGTSRPNGTISENIARFGNVEPEKVVAAAQMADVHELILRLPNGYDTPIGADGGVSVIKKPHGLLNIVRLWYCVF